MQPPRSRLMPTCLLMAIPTLACASAAPERIDAFGTTTNEFVGIGQLHRRLPEADIRVSQIDGIERAKVTLSGNLTGDRRRARHTALENLRQLGLDERKQMHQAADALVLAWRYGVHRYPAVVFDGHYVIYGITDLVTAYELFREWLEANVT